MLSMGDLKICRDCRHLIGEVQGYCWDPKSAEKGEDAPIKRADHQIDSLWYAIFSYFGDKVSMEVPKSEQIEGVGLGRLRQHVETGYPGPRLSYMSGSYDSRNVDFASQFSRKTF